MRPTVAPRVHTATPGGPTSDLVNDAAELIRQHRDPVAAARLVVARVRDRLERDGLTDDVRLDLALTTIDRDCLAAVMRAVVDAYDDANQHGAFATNGRQADRLAALHDAVQDADELLNDTGVVRVPTRPVADVVDRRGRV